MKTKLDFTSADPTAIHSTLQKPCCDAKPTHECHTHFLTEGLKTQVLENLSGDKTGTTAKILAEIARYDKSREFLVDENIISYLVANLSHLEVELLTQSCRALANLCYEMKAAQTMIINKGGLDAVICVIKSKQESSSESTKQLRTVAIGLLLNIISSSNQEIDTKIISSGLPEILVEFARAELDTKQVTNLSDHVMRILLNLTETEPMEKIFTLPVCQVALDLLRIHDDPDTFVSALEELEEVPDVVKFRFVSAGLFDFLVKKLEEQPKNASEEENAMFELVGRVLAQLLGGDDAMEYVYSKGQPALLKRLGEWLKCEDFNRRYSSALCVGNIARTDEHSIEIVNLGLHKDLMAILKKDASNLKMLHAALGTLRNLSIPKKNKEKLFADGLVDALLPLTSIDARAALPVVFKLVGTWRQLIDGQPSAALRLGKDKELLKLLVKWCDPELCSKVSAETSRLLCSFITSSRDRCIVENLVEVRAIEEITQLLMWDEIVMQLEAVNALTISGALLVGVPSQWETVLLTTEIGEKIKFCLGNKNLAPQLVDNFFTFLDVLLKYDKLKHHLRDTEILAALSPWAELSHFQSKMEHIRSLL